MKMFFFLRKMVLFIIILLISINTVACNTESVNKSKGETEKSSNVNFEDKNNFEEEIKNEISKNTNINSYKNTILKIKEYKNGYWVLMISAGEGGFISLNLIDRASDGKYTYKGSAGCEAALSMGFGVNRLNLGNDTIFYCNLNDSTWVPENDTRKETKYEKMVFKFDNGDEVTENVKNDKGYIVIVNNKVNIKSIELFNGNNEMVSTYKDIGKTDEMEFIYNK